METAAQSVRLNRVEAQRARAVRDRAGGAHPDGQSEEEQARVVFVPTEGGEGGRGAVNRLGARSASPT